MSKKKYKVRAECPSCSCGDVSFLGPEKLREKFMRVVEVNPAEIAASSMDEQFLKRILDIFNKHCVLDINSLFG